MKPGDEVRVVGAPETTGTISRLDTFMGEPVVYVVIHGGAGETMITPTLIEPA